MRERCPHWPTIWTSSRLRREPDIDICCFYATFVEKMVLDQMQFSRTALRASLGPVLRDYCAATSRCRSRKHELTQALAMRSIAALPGRDRPRQIKLRSKVRCSTDER